MKISETRRKNCQTCLLTCQIILTVLNFQSSEGYSKLKQKRQVNHTNRPTNKCGATGLRLNLDLEKLYGKWYPQVSLDMLNHLWDPKSQGNQTGGNSCLTLELSEGDRAGESMNLTLSYKNETEKFFGVRLGDESHPGKSKWAIKWPNGEDTLTSIVAAGTDWDTNESYDWIWTVDCDVNGVFSPGWAIFSRKKGISTDTVDTIMSLVEGIDGLDISNPIQIDPRNCN